MIRYDAHVAGASGLVFKHDAEIEMRHGAIRSDRDRLAIARLRIREQLLKEQPLAKHYQVSANTEPIDVRHGSDSVFGQCPGHFRFALNSDQ